VCDVKTMIDDNLGRYLEGDDRGLSCIMQFGQGLKLTLINLSFLIILGVSTLTTHNLVK
jgi:hypothetical protein